MNGHGAKEKAVSLRKIEANRRNGWLSTGPKSLEGKNVSRWNALKHGLLAREIVIPAGEGKENGAEFRNLLEQLREDLNPAGAIEEMLVEKVAVCYWRLRRVLRSEIGEIRSGLDDVTASRKRQRIIWKKFLEETTPEKEREWIEREQGRLNLPEGDAAEKILRYESALERQLYRALHHLERIQRRKKGEPVPPPVSVDFSGER